MEQIDMNKIYKTNFGFAMDYKIGQKNYLVQLIYPQENSSCHIPVSYTHLDVYKRQT